MVMDVILPGAPLKCGFKGWQVWGNWEFGLVMVTIMLLWFLDRKHHVGLAHAALYKSTGMKL